jgi:hypothetical protein
MVASAADISHYAPRLEIIVNGTRLSADMSHVITSVEIEQQLNKLNTFKFEVQDEYLPTGAPEQSDTRPFRWLKAHPVVPGSSTYRGGGRNLKRGWVSSFRVP